MPRSLHDVVDEVGKPAVNAPAALRAYGGVGLGREQRMRETDAVAVELDQLGLDGGVERSVVSDGEDRRRRKRRCRGKYFTDVLRLTGDSVTDQLLQPRGYGQRQTGIQLGATLRQHAPQLERVERVASRRLMQPLQERTRK